MKTVDGYLTVFLSLILSVMISLCLVLILGARENTRRMEVECVTDIGMNNILAEFHRELLNQYNLFFIDTSYGTENASYKTTEARLKDYLERNLSGDDLFLSFLYHNPVKLKVEDVVITGLSAASDEKGAVFRRQAVEVMYQRVGISYLKQIENWVNTVSKYDLNTRDILAECRNATADLEEWSNEALPKEAAADWKNPGAEVLSLWDAGILSLVVKDYRSISTQSADLTKYISSRKLLAGTGMNPAVTFTDGLWEQLVFQEYILAYTGHYGMEKENGYLQYQTEYILSGNETDSENLKDVVNQIFSIRTVANLLYLISDEERMQLTEAAATALAALFALPELAPLLQAVIVFAWAMVESISDVAKLLRGDRVPLLKSGKEWYYEIEEALAFDGSIEQAEKSDEKEEGLLYEDYLRILLCFQDKVTTTFRLMDIVEMDIRQTEGNESFRMDGCIDSIGADIKYSATDGRQYDIFRSYGY